MPGFAKYQEMLCNVTNQISSHELTDTDKTAMTQWEKGCQADWADRVEPELPPAEKEVTNSFLDLVVGSMMELAQDAQKTRVGGVDKSRVEALKNSQQIAQRTEEWYKEGEQLLTASQIATLFKSPRTRGQLVLEKAGLKKRDSSGPTVALTANLNPFLWGIRFEPVVNAVQCAMTNGQTTDLGRIRHPTDKHLAASPDGIVISGERTGRLVEFKAPISRVLNQKVPEDQFMQMQLQMEVTQVEECDQLEIRFASPQKTGLSMPMKEDPPQQSGQIAVIGTDTEAPPTRYEQSPFGADSSWSPSLEDDEVVLEVVPWQLAEAWLITVPRSTVWFQSARPVIDAFWGDVEKAKRGEFVLPPSSRPPKESAFKIIDDD